MSKDQLNAFIEKAKSDPELVKKLSACSDEQCVLIAKEYGFSIDLDELSSLLADSELQSASGGNATFNLVRVITHL